jgi:hypothetical protein
LHSSKDEDLVHLIETNFPVSVNPYFAEYWREPRPPLAKILDQLCASSAAFILWTRNVVDFSETRDWVLFELGVAKTLVEIGLLSGIWGWRAIDVELTDLLKSITEFSSFNRYDPQDCSRVVMEMINIASQL